MRTYGILEGSVDAPVELERKHNDREAAVLRYGTRCTNAVLTSIKSNRATDQRDRFSAFQKKEISLSL
jgi:hypothetical protein